MEYVNAILAPHLEHRQGFEFIAASAIDDAVQDGVVLLEMSFDIRLLKFYPDGLTELRSFIEEIELDLERTFEGINDKTIRWQEVTTEADGFLDLNKNTGKLPQRDANKVSCKEHISKLAMVTRPGVVLQLDFFVNGLLSLSTVAQYVRRYVDVIQLSQKSVQCWHTRTGHHPGLVPLYPLRGQGL